MGYWFIKGVLSPLLRLFFRPTARGLENVPLTGPAILAGNHNSFLDNFMIPLVVPRRVTYLAKSDYFTGRGVKGRLQAFFFRSAGQIPIDRSGGARQRGGAAHRPAGAAGGRAARALPRGHALARRPALPRQDRRRPDGAGGRRPGHPRRAGRHVRGAAPRHDDAEVQAGGR